MLNRAGLLFALVIFFADAYAENSIVIGQGIKVVGEPSCIGDCWVSGYVWLIDARRTVLGPPVEGKIRMVAASHGQPKDSYLKAVQLFVLSPVIADTAEVSSDLQFSLLASSPMYGGGRYCIPFKPTEVGIPLSDSEVERDEYNRYCFSKRSLLKATKRISTKNGKPA